MEIPDVVKNMTVKELQSTFLQCYGKATKSQNQFWLRKKVAVALGYIPADA